MSPTDLTLLESLFEMSLDIAGVASPDGRFVKLNDYASEALGYPREDLEGAEFLPLVHEDDRAATVLAMSRLSEGDDVTEFINRYRCADGQYKWLEWRARPDAEGQIFFIARDVSERVRLEEKLRSVNVLMREVSRLSGIGHWEVDPINDTIYWDPVVRAIHEVDDDFQPNLEEAVDFFPPEVRDQVNRHVSEGIEQGRSWEFELPMITAKGRRIWTRAVGHAVYENGEVVRLQGGFQDITEHREVLDNLARSSEAAETANRAKSDFLTNMSHELRTPLHGILGSAQLLETTSLDPSQRKYTDTIRSSGEILLGLIEDVLDLAQIEAGTLSLSNKEFGLPEMIGAAADNVSYLARAKGLAFATHLEPGLPMRAEGDPKRLSQVVTNFLGNAVKFTDAGKVELCVSAPGGDRLRVEVRDTGPGLTKQEARDVFSRFYQADATDAKHASGAGLGLAISRDIIDLAGGEIGVDSTPGSGSCFWFEVPMEFPSAPQRLENAVAKNQVRERHYRILVADDVPTNLMVAEAALRRSGCSVQTVSNGAEAIERLQQDEFDAVLMDIQMPGLSGDEAILQIRASDAAYSSLPIFAMTADATKGAVDRYLEIGATGYLSKPLRFDDMFKALDAVLARDRTRGAGMAPQPANASRG